MFIRDDLKDFLLTLPNNITLVAATKYIDEAELEKLYQNGLKNFGENRVDSFFKKYEYLKEYKDIKWHFIGHLQRNKTKSIINKIDYLHSLDSLELAKLINDNRFKPLDTFIEVSINLEENKNGVPYYEVESFIKELQKYPKIHLVGLMMMTIKNSEDKENQFAKLRKLKEQLEEKLQIKIPYLSMGMSEDYLEAIVEGATHIRLGRILFKE